jgi:hypothetical protein
MKTKTHISTIKAALMILCSFFLIALSFLSCNKESSLIQTTQTDEDQADLKCGHIYKAGDIFHLSGQALFHTWKLKDGTVLQDVHHNCWADLEFIDKNNFKFTFHEEKPEIPVTPVFVLVAECHGKIASSGILTFTYPTPIFNGMNITDIISQNSCATIWGPGVNKGTLVFIGKFDRKKFAAKAYFMAKIEEYCPNNTMFPTPVDGNIYWTFGHDLDVVN